MLPSAGLPGAAIDAASRSAFAADAQGARAFVTFVNDVAARTASGHATELYAARHAAPEDRNALIAAITGPGWQEMADAIIAGRLLPDLGADGRAAVLSVRDLPVSVWRGIMHLDEDGTPLPLP